LGARVCKIYARVSLAYRSCVHSPSGMVRARDRSHGERTWRPRCGLKCTASVLNLIFAQCRTCRCGPRRESEPRDRCTLSSTKSITGCSTACDASAPPTSDACNRTNCKDVLVQKAMAWTPPLDGGTGRHSDDDIAFRHGHTLADAILERMSTILALEQ